MTVWQGVAGAPVVAETAGAERRLLDAARRATMPGLAPPGLMALVVRLGMVPAPGPRPHHRRVAQAILDEAVQRHGGQVFAPRNGDLVLLAPAAALRAAGRGETLPEVLARLLADLGSALLVTWALPAERERLLAYAHDRLAERAVQLPDPPLPVTGGQARRPETPLVPGLLHRQTAMRLAADGRLLEPLFREIGATAAALQAQTEAEALEPDPYLLRYLARQLETRLLAALPGEIGRRGALDPEGGPRLHLNLSPDAVMGEAFLGFAERCAAGGLGLGVEIALVEAAADPEGFEAARRRLAGCGVRLALDGVSAHALRLTGLAALAADMVKLDWSPALATRPAAELREIDAALRALGRERVVLAGADAEVAIHWGIARGLRRFQGRHVDAMLGASRLATCRDAARCTLRQCMEREGAVAGAGRMGCTNLALLDAGMAAA